MCRGEHVTERCVKEREREREREREKVASDQNGGERILDIRRKEECEREQELGSHAYREKRQSKRAERQSPRITE